MSAPAGRGVRCRQCADGARELSPTAEDQPALHGDPVLALGRNDITPGAETTPGQRLHLMAEVVVVALTMMVLAVSSFALVKLSL